MSTRLANSGGGEGACMHEFACGAMQGGVGMSMWQMRARAPSTTTAHKAVLARYINTIGRRQHTVMAHNGPSDVTSIEGSEH